MTADPAAVHALIQGAYDLLARSGHCRRALALDARGDRVLPYDPRAVCFCASGAVLAVAIRKCLDAEVLEAALARLSALAEPRLRGRRKPRVVALVQFNDSAYTRREDVLTLFSDALDDPGASEAPRSAWRSSGDY